MVKGIEGEELVEMKRKIDWKSYVFDEIELVYEKAKVNDTIGNLLECLETLALTEAKNNCSLVTTDAGGRITPEQFDALTENDKEVVIKVLSDLGLDGIDTDIRSASIFVRFTPKIQRVLGCTIFNLLNRIEKLDGTINVLKPNWTLELQVPLGAKKGLFQWEMLIMQLYPWISVREVSSETVAEELVMPNENSDETTEEDDRLNVNYFLKTMKEKSAFRKVMETAKSELESIIQSGVYTKITKKQFSHKQWYELNEIQKETMVVSIGLFSFYVGSIICIDFIDYIPNCAAIALLFVAWNRTMEKQVIDAGEGTDVTKFVEALNLLHTCYEKWDCTIAYPISVKIGGKLVADEQKKEKIEEKKPFWKRLFGK